MYCVSFLLSVSIYSIGFLSVHFMSTLIQPVRSFRTSAAVDMNGHNIIQILTLVEEDMKL